ncbi:MAG: endonuclease/exonuclease/phosphatase family protein [Bacteroidales bacterium]|nr:endonuclease/exonuclease/phosphatase family protein [Bacteroidales bacterium]
MKRFVLLALAATILIMPACQKKADSIKVMSYNIRYGTANDGDYSWPLRRDAAAAMILDQRPAVFGVQEALPMQLDHIRENCPMYRWVGVGREDGVSEGEHMSVFYDTTRVALKDWGTYWLSETPDEPSYGWDATCRRTATWVLMDDLAAGKSFYFVNTHLDHVGVVARKRGLLLLVERIGKMNPENFPMILCGDFNIYPDNPGLDELRPLMLDARETAPETDWGITWHNWGKAQGNGPIDYIWYKGFSACTEFARVTQPYLDCPYVSDHYPVTAVLKY